MSYLKENLDNIKQQLAPHKVTLVAVSKTHPAEKIQELYDLGQRHFGENKVQEMLEKYEVLPKDIHWHLIGHLQTNKVKYIAPFVQLIHSADSVKLIQEIEKQGAKNNRVIDCLLQIYIADEETKFGMDESEAEAFLTSSIYANLKNVRICGLMGMASNVDDENQVRAEFAGLKKLFDKLKIQYFANKPEFEILSMGMSGDYMMAIEEGSNMVRVGSAIFGERKYSRL
ncbi:MAG: YggS family pyridoxal phosphate-dependent enzyme [Sphingobacteriales bacterium]|nr:MAG: YggS family pyridoxal phosphate-dependent enzyme [Sphingobacteriales bacterium]